MTCIRQTPATKLTIFHLHLLQLIVFLTHLSLIKLIFDLLLLDWRTNHLACPLNLFTADYISGAEAYPRYDLVGDFWLFVT